MLYIKSKKIYPSFSHIVTSHQQVLHISKITQEQITMRKFLMMRVRDADPDPHYFESKDTDPQKNADPGSRGINLRKNILKFIVFIADILLMRANL